MKRAAVSIPSNIAEGAGRNSNKEFKHFLSISLGSLFEIETQLILANRFGLVNSTVTENINIKISELERMIFALEKTLS